MINLLFLGGGYFIHCICTQLDANIHVFKLLLEVSKNELFVRV